MCGASTYWKCMICNAACCVLEKYKWNGAVCVRRFHNQDYFGLARCDYKLHGNRQKDWVQPTAPQIKLNKRHIANLLTEMDEEEKG